MKYLILINFVDLKWWPFLNLWSDSFCVQLLILYLFFLLFVSINLYYAFFYFFLLCLFIGLFLCLYQIELFTGFLWLIECVVLFVFLLLLFFLKITGSWVYLMKHVKLYKYLIFFFFFLIIPIFPNFYESYRQPILNNIDCWDNYYEALINTNINDFIAFLISYYLLNSYLLILIIFILLIATIVCVNLNKLFKTTRIQNIDFFFKFLHFFHIILTAIFMRQQNLFDQENQPTGTRIFKKKIMF